MRGDLPVEHPVDSPFQPVGQEQVFGATHVPPFSHGTEQIAATKIISTTTTKQNKTKQKQQNKWKSNLRVEHPLVAPVQPAGQEQLFGAMHVPPFWQRTEQIAERN
jgi:hypothetical protein